MIYYNLIINYKIKLKIMQIFNNYKRQDKIFNKTK